MKRTGIGDAYQAGLIHYGMSKKKPRVHTKQFPLFAAEKTLEYFEATCSTQLPTTNRVPCPHTPFS